MPASRCSLAFLRSKSAILALALVFTSSLVLAQDSFMFHYTSSGLDGEIVNQGDFNNDGIPDLVVGNNQGTGGYGISVLLGKGDGRFQNALNAAKGVGTFAMAVGDFNGDGKLDVAVAGYVGSEQNVIQILLGKGDGRFTTGQTITLTKNISASSLTAADFNGDGKLDLAMASPKLLLFKGAGNGTFTQAASIKVGTQNALAQVRTGDFNGDGKADLTISDYYDIYVLFNTGNFTFKTVKVADAAVGIFAAPADVNQDGITDLLVSYYTCSTIKSVSCPNWEVLLGSRSETFTKSASMSVSSETGFSGVTAADINGDGINDIVG